MADPIRWQDAWWHQRPDGSWLRFNEATQTWELQPLPGHPVYAPSPGLSTGAKWGIALGIGAAVLVVVMILAAIAIPVFLRQREKGWESQVQTTLERAALAEETYLTTHASYTQNVDDLAAEGLRVPSDIHLEIPRVGPSGYCIEAMHERLPNEIWSYDARSGTVEDGPCL